MAEFLTWLGSAVLDRKFPRHLIFAFVALALVSGCASTASREAGDQGANEDQAESDGWAESESDDWADTESDDAFYGEDYDEGENDPLEVPNRFIFAFNEALDVLILQPAAATYRFLVPSPIRNSVQSFMRNLRTPVVLVNDLLQGKANRAGDTAMRFLINSTVGVLGLIDVADGMGYPYHSEDFGQTLGSYGVGEGFYLVLPLFGPSSVRDGTGRLVDQLFDPLTYVGYYFDDEPGVSEALIGRTVLEGVDFRARNIETVDEIKRDALDVYARFRSLYRQYRQNEIEDGGADPDDSGGGFSGLESAPAESLAAE